MEVHLLDTQGISGAYLPYRRREKRIFVIYSSSRQLYYYRSPVKFNFSPLKVFTGGNFEARTLGFLAFGRLFIPPQFLVFYIFNSKIMCFVRVLFFTIFFDIYYFFLNFLSYDLDIQNINHKEM